MIEYYYKAYHGTADFLLGKISKKGLWSTIEFVEEENDVLVANAIYILITKQLLKDKEEIFQYIWKRLAPLYKEEWGRMYEPIYGWQQYSEDKSKRIFAQIFDFVWKKKFSQSKDGKHATRFANIARRNYPLAQRVFCSYTFVVAYVILFVFGSDYALCHLYTQASDGSYIWLKNIAVLFCGTVFCCILKRLHLIPACCFLICVAICVYHLFMSNVPFYEQGYNLFEIKGIKLEIMKSDILLGCMYFALYPVIYSLKSLDKQE